MRIVVTGGTGFIGKHLVEAFLQQGHELTLLSRAKKGISAPFDRYVPEFKSSVTPAKAGVQEALDSGLRRGDQFQYRFIEQGIGNKSVRYALWNPDDETSFVSEVDGADAVINLAGEPIAKRWTQAQKKKILTSRVSATQIIARSIGQSLAKPKVLVNASAVGYYGPRGGEALTESSARGHDFLGNVCQAWEAHAIRAEDFGTRVVRLRIGIVLGKGGGALKKMLLPFKLFLGGWLGSGKQWMSWIQVRDVVNLILFALGNTKVRGSLNAAAPNAVTNKEFSLMLAKAIKRPCLVPVPAFVLRLLLGEMSGLLLEGQRVLPEKARALGFTFQYPNLKSALEESLR